MILESIRLTNFKNYELAEVSFCNAINCITGLNGSGKTNLLDAIHYLSMTKSAFNSIDSQNIRNGEMFFAVQGNFSLGKKKQKVICSLKTGVKKNLTVNEVPYDKLSQHLGKFPLVLIAPNDDELIRESSETRRKFFDSTISQTNPSYLQDLITYTHFLKQRNALLKQINETGKRDQNLLDQYDDKLINLSVTISKVRSTFVNDYLPDFKKHYELLSENRENVQINYHSMANETGFKEKFKKSIEKDVILQRTNVGIHKDDYEFLIREKAVKKFGSQGQQKSFLVSLKLAQFDFLVSIFGFAPLLLLDDIFDKLDDQRITKLMELISRDQFQQIFITDARPERTNTLIQTIDSESRVFHVENNQIVNLE